MAKAHKKTVDYFPHPVNHGRKMQALERKFGNDGYAVWMKTLEELGRVDNHVVKLDCEHQVELFADRCLVDAGRFIEIIETLVRFGDFDRQIWEEHRAIFSEKFKESVRAVYQKRRAEPPSREYILSILESEKGAKLVEQVGAEVPVINDYPDIYAHHPILAAQAVTGETEESNPKGVATLRKYLRTLSIEDSQRGARMFREVLAGVYADHKAGEINNPAAVLNKKLKEICA